MSVVLAALLGAAAAVTADPARHAVTFTAVATDMDLDTPVEFLFAGPDSDHDYEAMFLTEAGVKEIADAFDRAGIPRGGAYDPVACRFWPVGAKLDVTPSVWDFVKETRGEGLPDAVFTGGTRERDGSPVAATNMPLAVFALYSMPQALILLDGAFDQSAVYGRFVPKKRVRKGTRQRFTVSWDGRTAPVRHTLVLAPGRLKEALLALQAVAATNAVDVLADFRPELTLAEAAEAAKALAVVDSVRVKLNGRREGQFFFRAFLPLEKWRDRRERLTQPLEVRVGAKDEEYTVVDEDWSGEGLDPALTPRKVPLAEALKTKSDTCFIYAAPGTSLSRLYRVAAKLPRTIRNYYLYAEPN